MQEDVDKKYDPNSILDSVKDLLDIPIETNDFDHSVIININAAMFTLQQLGVVPETGFSIEDNTTTYEDYLPNNPELHHPVKMYLYMKTKIVFDTSTTSSSVLEVLKEQIREMEVRFLYQVDVSDH